MHFNTKALLQQEVYMHWEGMTETTGHDGWRTGLVISLVHGFEVLDESDGMVCTCNRGISDGSERP